MNPDLVKRLRRHLDRRSIPPVTVSPATGQSVALRRARGGRVACHGGRIFTDAGRPIGQHFWPHLQHLLDTGHIRIWCSHPEVNCSYLCVTPAGEDLYATLEHQRRPQIPRQRDPLADLLQPVARSEPATPKATNAGEPERRCPIVEESS